MTTAILFLGSNLGPRRLWLQKALKKINLWPQTKVVTCSKILETQPEGYLQQPNFFNQALKIQTELRPLVLLLWAKKTEVELGRAQRFSGGPREIDIDVLKYGMLKMNTLLMVLPHPRLKTSPSIQASLSCLK